MNIKYLIKNYESDINCKSSLNHLITLSNVLLFNLNNILYLNNFKIKKEYDIKYILFILKYINVKDNNNSTPLYSSVYCNNLECVKYFIKLGANLNVSCRNGYSPLTLACNKGYFEIIKVLIENGANIHHKSNSGFTTLMAAIECGSFEIIKYLISKEINVNDLDKEGVSALMTVQDQISILGNDLKFIEIENRKLYQIFDFLLENGANLYHKSDWCESVMETKDENLINIIKRYE